MINTMARGLWVRPTLRTDHLYSEENVVDILDLEDAKTLADWRTRKVGPEWTTLPDGQIRYFGSALLALTYPPVDALSDIDPRTLFPAPKEANHPLPTQSDSEVWP